MLRAPKLGSRGKHGAQPPDAPRVASLHGTTRSSLYAYDVLPKRPTPSTSTPGTRIASTTGSVATGSAAEEAPGQERFLDEVLASKDNVSVVGAPFDTPVVEAPKELDAWIRSRGSSGPRQHRVVQRRALPQRSQLLPRRINSHALSGDPQLHSQCGESPSAPSSADSSGPSAVSSSSTDNGSSQAMHSLLRVMRSASAPLFKAKALLLLGPVLLAYSLSPLAYPATGKPGSTWVPQQPPSGIPPGRPLHAMGSAAAAGSHDLAQPSQPWSPEAAARIVSVVSCGRQWPGGSLYKTTYERLAGHTAQRLAYTDVSYEMKVFNENDLAVDPGTRAAFMSALRGAQILVGIDMSSTAAVQVLEEAGSQGLLPATRLFLSEDIVRAAEAAHGSQPGAPGQHSSQPGPQPQGTWAPPSSPGNASSALTSSSDSGSSSGNGSGAPVGSAAASNAARVVSNGHTITSRLLQLTSLGGLAPHMQAGANTLRLALAKSLSWSPYAKALKLYSTARELFSRHTTDDFLMVYLILINEYVTTVPQVASTTKGFDLPSLVCMVKYCGKDIVNCVNDPTCKTALDCLNSCAFNDQVCQYRCIVSYETPLLSKFSLCILELHNCRSLSALPPAVPDPAPMSSFRGMPMTHEMAEELFIGWFSGQQSSIAPTHTLPYSWLVAAGKNPAYDYFPAQHQIFYRGKARNTVWYEPVFKVLTLDGRSVWRRRVYRVRRAKQPGTFNLSVLDNGVTSKEFWRILDCADDLSFCLFYYSGAASTAGLSYSGAVLGTPDGNMPTSPEALGRIEAALERAGIKMWELSLVDNSAGALAGAPLAPLTGPIGGDK